MSVMSTEELLRILEGLGNDDEFSEAESIQEEDLEVSYFKNYDQKCYNNILIYLLGTKTGQYLLS